MLFSYVTMIFVGIIIWLAVLHNKVEDLSISLNELKKIVANKQSGMQSNCSDEVVSPEPQKNPEAQITEPPAPENISASSEPAYIEESYKVSERLDLQKVFLGNIFNKVGAIAIIVALIIFIKLVSLHIVITPLMKVIFAYLVGFGLIGTAFYLHRKEALKNYSEVMLGTGFADLFITTFCAYAIFDFLNTPSVIIIGSLLLITTYLIADKMKTLSMLIIGLIGAYLTPFCAKAGANALLSYFVFINMLSVLFTLRNKSTNWVNIINLFLTMVVFLCNFGTKIHIAFPVILWGIYLIYDVLRTKGDDVDNIVCYANYGILTLFSSMIFHDAYNKLAILLSATAVIYLALSYFSRKVQNNLYKFYEYSAVINIWLIGFFLLNTFQRAIGWSILALLITFTIQKIDAKYLKGSVIWSFSTAIIAALCAKYSGENCLVATYAPIFNIRTLLFVFPVLSMIISALIMKNDDKKMHNLLLFSGLSLGYIYLTGEINSILSKSVHNSELLDFNRNMVDIIIGFVYALNAKRFAKIHDSKLFNVAGLVIFGISLIALMICSYFYYGSYIVIFNMKVAAFVLAIVTSFIFSKWDNTDVYKYLGIILGFLICHSESNQIFYQNPKMEYVISLSWVLYSGITTIAGILKNKKYLINAGIFLIILAIFRIFIYDLANVEAIFKLVAFLALGVILMLVSYIYSANKNRY